MKHAIRYARSGDVHIAYKVLGHGPIDIVLVLGWISHLEAMAEDPAVAHFFDRLASFARVIVFDKRGTGLSDRVDPSALPTLEQRMDDVRAVMDAANSGKAALVGVSEGGPMCALFSATYPSRTRALVTYGSYARWLHANDHPWTPTLEDHERALQAYETGWGTSIGLRHMAPSVARDEACRERWGRFLRAAASPGAAMALLRMNIRIDVCPILPTIDVPTLVLHRTGDKLIDVRCGRYLAANIPGAKLVELPGDDHLPWYGDSDALADEIEEFLTGVRQVPHGNRALATVVFTDIVGSTEHAAALGDAKWRELLQRYHERARREVALFHGKEVDTAGDGFFATFDGPARGVRCACAIRDAVAPLGLEVRGGVHTGECEMAGGKVSGIAVHTGARVAAVARGGEVLVSSTVRDLVAGSGLRFVDRGLHTLKGIAGEWRLFGAEPGTD